jgi:hypothetical protein
MVPFLGVTKKPVEHSNDPVAARREWVWSLVNESLVIGSMVTGEGGEEESLVNGSWVIGEEEESLVIGSVDE